MKRREFLKKSGQALTFAAATGAVGAFFHNRDPFNYHPHLSGTTEFGIAADSTYPGLTLAKDSDHVAALNKALDAIGGIKRFVKPGERVTIKPNIGWDRTPEQAADTNPLLVGEMVRLCKEANASRVIVTDITCHDPRRCFLRSGIRDSAEKAGAEVILPDDKDLLNIDLQGELLTEWPVLKYFIETDRFINMPIVKHHSLSACTIGMKNLYGVLGGRRHQLHQSIDQSIVDLAAYFRPTLIVVDATRVLFRNGPTGGSLDDVLIADSVICSTDQVAADSRGAEFMSLTGEKVGHIVLAEKRGLGKIDYRSAGYKEIL